MPIKGYNEYKRREFCNDIKCRIQMLMNAKEQNSDEYEKLREICKTDCIHTTFEFHHWLIDKGFIIIKNKHKN